MTLRRGVEERVFILLSAVALFVLMARPAAAQTARQPRTPGAAAANLPNVIDGCYEQSPNSQGKICLSWVRDGDKFIELQDGPSTILRVERFDAGAAVFSGKHAGPLTATYSGKITGNHIQGTLKYTYDAIPQAKPAILNWSASFFYTPTGDPATGRHVYLACETQVSIINTANHSVATVKLDDPNKPPSAMAVSPDSSKAYLSSAGDPWHPATLSVIDGPTGTIAQRFSMKDTPTPSGVASLAVSGDGSTLYGFGWDRKHLGNAVVALDAASGAAKAAPPLPKGYQGMGKLVVSGSKLVLDDGSVLDVAFPSGASAVFGSDGQGALAAFPDGTRICSGGQVLVIETRTPLRKGLAGCGAISPDGTKIYLSAAMMGIRSFPGSPGGNGNTRETVVAVGGIGVGVTPDGTTLYTVDAGVAGDGSPAHTGHATVFTYDAVSNLMTDAIRVCEKPRLLGTAPLGPQIAAPKVAPMVTAQVKAKGPEAVANQDPDRVVATIDGKPISARQAMNILGQVAPQVRTQKEHESQLPQLVQQIYMQHQIAAEAVKLHLSQKKPWNDQLGQACMSITKTQCTGAPNVPLPLLLEWNNARERILWNAYFGQASTPEERQAILKQKREQYQIKVQDPDFFEVVP